MMNRIGDTTHLCPVYLQAPCPDECPHSPNYQRDSGTKDRLTRLESDRAKLTKTVLEAAARVDKWPDWKRVETQPKPARAPAGEKGGA